MKAKIDEDLKRAMRDKIQTKINVLRGLKSAFTTASLQKGNIDSELSDSEIIQIIRKQLNQRQESIKQFIDGQRFDLVAKEEAEMEIIKEYLPAEITDDELKAVVELAIGEYENPTKKNMGDIIKKIILVLNGRADNKRVSQMVGSMLQ